MAVGRDSFFIRHEGKESASQKQKRLERKSKWNKSLKLMMERTNKAGGQNALESE
jgi:hypothetical protein